MRLKKVKIFGFKTFADKTELNMDGERIAVVGPNGCGKSNIVDAILWGLGEPNARALRAQIGQDVIFAGSSIRKGLGFAEVTLVFDNEDGVLPIGTSEVEITRRLTRSGESDYRINRRSCRLRDIVDLLADTGLGRTGYAIVGQKEIDAALAASAQDRRAWIDEAAGVQRYRLRRQESLRRLELAADHLARIGDLLSEIEAQKDPLEQEAEVAQRYKALSTRLRELESGLLITEVAQTVEEVLRLTKRIESAQSSAREDQKQAREFENQSDTLQKQALSLEHQIERLRSQIQSVQQTFQHAQVAMQLGQQKLQGLSDLEQSFTDRHELEKQQLLLTQKEMEGVLKEVEAEQQALTKLNEELLGAGTEAKRIAKELENFELELHQARATQEEHLKEQAHLAQRTQRRKQIQVELKGIEESLPELEKGILEAEQVFLKNQELQADFHKQLKLVEQAEKEQKRLEEGAAQNLREHLEEKARLDGKKRGLEATLETHEGLMQGTRAVLTLVQQGQLTGEYVPVSQAIRTSTRFALAMEVALGAAGGDVIVPDEDHARRAIALLKEHRLGRATFQPIPLMRPFQRNPDLERLLKEKGVVGTARELVECEERFRPVVDSLLGRIIVVEHLEDGLKLAKTGGWSRIVSLEGEVIHSAGAVTGGASARQGTGVLHRRAELAEVEKNLVQLEQKIQGLIQRSKQNNHLYEELEVQAQSWRDKLAFHQSELEDAQSWLTNLRHEKLSAEREKARLENELKQLDQLELAQKPLPDLQKLEAQRDELVKRIASRSTDEEHAERRLKEAEQRLWQAQQRQKDIEKRLKLAQDAQTSREIRQEGLEPERERLLASIEKATKEAESAETKLQQTNKELESKAEEKKLLLAQIEDLERSIKDSLNTAAAATDLAHQGELMRAKADARRAGAMQKLLEEYGINEEEALEMAPGIKLPVGAAQEVFQLRRDLKAMGEVNLGAIEAYERLRFRYDELKAQEVDVCQGKAEVEASIRDLDKLTQDRFVQTFEQVRGAFGATFTKLFEGGEAELKMSDAQNLLDSGIEVEVTLPGKKRQRLELLSGGERALSACAFLLALLKVRPSPLVILDEVDAPLDGRNVERFIEQLKSFEGLVQFLIITHNPVTIEAAPIWFGVTMQEPGVSTVIPYRVPEPALAQAVVHGAFLKG